MHHRPFPQRRLIDPLLELFRRVSRPGNIPVNYLLSPLQLIFIMPLLRFGERLAGAPPFPVTIESVKACSPRESSTPCRFWQPRLRMPRQPGWCWPPMLIIGLYRGLEPAFRHLQRAP